jgi:hypothetical protein
MRTTWFLAFIMLTQSQSTVITGPINTWSGFDYEWLRDIGGLTTPHRMGSLGSEVHEGRVDYSFTPGVDGDYATPTTYGILYLSCTLTTPFPLDDIVQRPTVLSHEV